MLKLTTVNNLKNIATKTRKMSTSFPKKKVSYNIIIIIKETFLNHIFAFF